MTNEFAIALLKQDIQNSKINISYRHNEVGIKALDLAIKALEQQSMGAKTYLKRREENYVEYNVEWFLKNWELELEILSGGKIKPTDADCISRAQALHACCDEWNKDYKAIMKSIRQLPSVTPQQVTWIPVSERLPDTDDEVLCWYEYYHWSQEKVLPEYGLGRYLRNTSAWCGEVANGKDVRVIAWMPLPEPYERGVRANENGESV